MLTFTLFAGFYCPPDQLCIIPCPLGAYCVKDKLVNATVSLLCYSYCIPLKAQEGAECTTQNGPFLVLFVWVFSCGISRLTYRFFFEKMTFKLLHSFFNIIVFLAQGELFFC